MQTLLKRVAFLCLLGFPVAVVGSRIALFDFRAAILVVAITLLVSLLVFLASAFYLLKRKYPSPEQAKSLKLAAVMSAVPLLGIGSVIVSASDVPKIHNISTNVIDPPAFDKIVPIRTADHNSLQYTADVAELQQAAYPNLKTLHVEMNLQDAQNKAVEVSASLGWQLINNDIQQGLIEASDTSRLWGFTDDIVIRFKQDAQNQTAIDLRSVSRVGQSDLGANAKRIESFINAFNAKN